MDKQIQHTKIKAELNQKKADMQEYLNKKRLKELKKRKVELLKQMEEVSSQLQFKNSEIGDLFEKL